MNRAAPHKRLLVRRLADNEVERVAAVLGLARLYQGNGFYLVAWENNQPRVLHGSRAEQASPIDQPVPPPFIGQRVSGPQRTQQLNLLLNSPATCAVVLIQCLELALNVSYAHAQAEPPAAERVDLGGLLGDGDRLPEGQYQHPCEEFYPPGNCSFSDRPPAGIARSRYQPGAWLNGKIVAAVEHKF